MTAIDKIKHFFQLMFRHGEAIEISYPVSWNTMSQEDFKNVCIILSQPHGRKESLFLCLCALAHIRPDNPIKYDPRAIRDNVVFIIGGKAYTFSPKVIQSACEQLEYIYDSVGLPPCPIPGVDRKLYGISFKTYYKADAMMLQYSATKDERCLKEAAIALSNGRIRKLLPWQRTGLPIWWAGLKDYLMQKYPHVLQEGGGTMTDRTMDEILLDLLSYMNDGRPQDNERILATDAHSVLHCLDKIYEKNAHD